MGGSIEGLGGFYPGRGATREVALDSIMFIAQLLVCLLFDVLHSYPGKYV